MRLRILLFGCIAIVAGQSVGFAKETMASKSVTVTSE